jgi:hypothetical protein
MKTMLITILVALNSIALTEADLINYNSVLSNLSLKQSELKIEISSNKKPNLEQVSDLLYNTLKDSIFPAWNDTPWDFNGISNMPGEGEIACGYFVSTTLKHAGFNLNRYKLAQQAASVIATKVCGKEKMNRFTSPAITKTYASEIENGLFIVGLDFHVGFLLVEKGEVFFVHSDYYNGKVVRELASISIAFNSSNIYVVGELTNNNNLMKSWINGTKLF